MILGLHTLMWNNLPLEARVYVQKGITGNWSVTAMIGKHELFSTGSLYNQTSQNLGRILLDLCPNQLNKITKQLTNHSLNICSYLDHYIPDLGCCTLDYVLEQNGKPSLIYLGGWEQNDYLYTVDKNLWLKYHENALDYLQYLLINNYSGEAENR